MARARETAPAMAVIARMKFPAFAAKKNSTCLIAYVNLVSKLASVFFTQVIFASWRLRVESNGNMRYEQDHKARTHQRILKNAARRFRAEGLNGPGVATVMKASGLTVGGFYKHFRSKDELLAEAIEAGYSEFGEKAFAALESVAPAERWKEVVRWYLSPEHCEHAETGCPIAALAPEIARAAPAVKKRIAGVMGARRERMLEFMPGRTADERERSYNIIFPAMTGAISTARILPDPVERQKILNSVRDHLLESF